GELFDPLQPLARVAPTVDNGGNRNSGGHTLYEGFVIFPASTRHLCHLPDCVPTASLGQYLAAHFLHPRERRNLDSESSPIGRRATRNLQIRDRGHTWAHKVDCRCRAVARTVYSLTLRRSRDAT